MSKSFSGYLSKKPVINQATADEVHMSFCLSRKIASQVQSNRAATE
jgi:hypothetical protein